MSNVISEKQQKNTLRGKKAKRGSVKNVLTSPYTHYWPLLKIEDDNSLRRVLKTNLPRINERKRNVPWEEIKRVPKEERRAYRKKLSDLASEPVDATPKYMYFGINEVTRLLERDEALSVLLSNDVSPHLMIKHLVDLCVFKRVTILIVPDFKDFLKKVTGLNSAAIAFKKSVEVPPNILSVLGTINDIFAKYPIPTTHAAFDIGESNFLTIPSNDNREKKTDTSKKSLKDVYLFRNPGSPRIFIPKNAQIDKMEIDSSGFISLGDTAATNTTTTITSSNPTDNYRSLIVKQIRGNPDRNKRKLGMIKHKRKKQKLE